MGVLFKGASVEEVMLGHPDGGGETTVEEGR